jgi:uncharacterized protein (DUF1501 family)
MTFLYKPIIINNGLSVWHGTNGWRSLHYGYLYRDFVASVSPADGGIARFGTVMIGISAKRLIRCNQSNDTSYQVTHSQHIFWKDAYGKISYAGFF